MAPLKPLFAPTTTPPPASSDNKVGRLALLHNNFQFTTWLLAAAAAQGIFTWLFPTAFTFIPALLILGYRVIDVFLIMYGIKPNPYMDGVINHKFSAQLPFEDGSFGERPSRDKMVVLILGSKSNHPLGIFSPAYQKVGQLFADMVEDLEQNRDEYSYLTNTRWISNTDTTINAAREIMTVFYFRSMEGVHKFAHAAAHRKGWDWWNRTAKEHPDISICHEVYEAQAGHWENVYVNYRPMGLATAQFPLKTSGEKEGEKKQWVGAIVDASKANMKNAKARLGWDSNGN
ncbi:hypothetical protein BJY01DRAFT_145128 [Aspergillus pseudoustus]|uniref:Uncharacterized protein n=1 Tax=Aspergillus pseudoustus TaxID=1810923 RepID=A0ABR4IIS0_9EURO